jgi:hypothetical protein
MKQLSIGLCAFAIFFALVSSPPPVQAQTTALGYAVSDEVTLTGTVTNVLTKSLPGMIVGSHLLLATPDGPVDASLGRFGLIGDGALSVAAGQQIEATGVMKTIQGRSFLLVRTVKVSSGEVYIIRTEHGFPVSPRARRRAEQNTEHEEESR